MGILEYIRLKYGEEIETLMTFLKYNNIKGYLVGGVVRDYLLKEKVNDIDICVEEDPQNFIKKIPKIKRYIYYPDFQTSTLYFNTGVGVDVIRCRKEEYPYSGALPLVAPSNLYDDLYRRDFTINAISYDLLKDKYIDYYNGMKDINNKIIKKISVNSYKDDPSRIFRAIKYSSRYNFYIKDEEEIKELIKNNILDNISCDRIIKEIYLLCKEENWIKCIKTCEYYGVFNLKNSLERENLIFKDSLELRIINLYLNIKDKKFKKIFFNNSFLNKDLRQAFQRNFNNTYIKENIIETKYNEVNVKQNECEQEIKYEKELEKIQDNYSIYKFLYKLNKYDLMILSYNKKLAYKIYNYMNMENLSLNINGKFLINNGIKEGKLIGQILNYLNKFQINMNLQLKDSFIKENLGEIINDIKYKNR